MAEEKNNAPRQEENLSQLLQVRRDKLKELQESGNDPFQITKYERRQRHAPTSRRILTPWRAGRCPSPAASCPSGAWARCPSATCRTSRAASSSTPGRDEMDEAEYNRFKKFDIGDIVGVKGVASAPSGARCPCGRRSVTLLSKSLLPLPEKFHGLTNTELRYRQRYVDLIVNPEVQRTFVLRSQFVKHVRDFLDSRGYMEVETPVLNTISGGATARPFHHPPQHPGHRHVPAHRHRAAPEAAHRGRHGPGV